MNLKSDIEKMVYNLNETRNYIAQHCLDILKSSNKLDDVYLLREVDTEDINNIESKVRNFLRPFIQEKSVMPESSVSKVNLSIHDILRFLEKNLSDEIWHVYPSTSMGCSVIKSKKSRLIYYMDGWDTSNPIGPSKVYSKLKRIVKGKKIDKWIFLANKLCYLNVHICPEKM